MNADVRHHEILHLCSSTCKIIRQLLSDEQPGVNDRFDRPAADVRGQDQIVMRAGVLE